jgi:membrane protease YdiL (CAAX protease family)
MQFIKEWIRRRPVIAFYILCYAISWGLWLPLLLSGGEIAEIIAAVGLFGGPGIACILVARNSPATIPAGRRVPYRLSFLGAWIVCALILGLNQYMTVPGFPVVAYVFVAIMALVPAYLLASALSGPPGVRRTLSSLVRPRGNPGWYLLALGLPLAIRLTSVWVSKMLGWPLLSDPHIPSSLLQLAGPALVAFLYTLVYAGGLNEEIGWTGLALPRLLARFNPLVATILVWGLWMLWHVPLHMGGLFDLNPHVLLGSFLGRFLLTWLFIRSSGGILSAILLHVSVNVVSQYVPLTYASLPVDAFVAILVILAGQMWRKLPQSSPAAFGAQISEASAFDAGQPANV